MIKSIQCPLKHLYKITTHHYSFFFNNNCIVFILFNFIIIKITNKSIKLKILSITPLHTINFPPECLWLLRHFHSNRQLNGVINTLMMVKIWNPRKWIGLPKICTEKIYPREYVKIEKPRILIPAKISTFTVLPVPVTWFPVPVTWFPVPVTSFRFR